MTKKKNHPRFYTHAFLWQVKNPLSVCFAKKKGAIPSSIHTCSPMSRDDLHTKRWSSSRVDLLVLPRESPSGKIQTRYFPPRREIPEKGISPLQGSSSPLSTTMDHCNHDLAAAVIWAIRGAWENNFPTFTVGMYCRDPGRGRRPRPGPCGTPRQWM